MSHQQYPPQPEWDAPQHPPKKKPKAGNIAAVGCLGVVVLIIAIVAVSLAVGGNDSSDAAPDYKIVAQDNSGNTRNVTVEVDSTKDLRAVFDAVTNDLTHEAGYWVVINCSTGGTKNVDNRLANGKYAVGRIGAATTGLKDGDSELSTNKGRSCPAKS